MSATTTMRCPECRDAPEPGVRLVADSTAAGGYRRFCCPRCLSEAEVEVAPPGTIAGLEAEAARLRAERDAITEAYIEYIPAFVVADRLIVETWQAVIPERQEHSRLSIKFRGSKSKAEAVAAVRKAAGLGADAPAAPGEGEG